MINNNDESISDFEKWSTLGVTGFLGVIMLPLTGYILSLNISLFKQISFVLLMILFCALILQSVHAVCVKIENKHNINKKGKL